jgi:hypothetical protein
MWARQVNVPLYAASLIVFSLAYLEVGLLLSASLSVTLCIMAIVLAIQIAFQDRELTGSRSQTSDGSAHIRRRKWARGWASRDAGIDLVFIGVTWVIFTELGETSQMGGIGWSHPIGGPLLDIALLAAGSVLLPLVVVLLLIYRFRERRVNVLVKRLAEAFDLALAAGGQAPVSREDSPDRSPTECQASEATNFAFTLRPVPSKYWAPPHNSDTLPIGLNGPRPALGMVSRKYPGAHGPPRRFTVCSRHLEQLLIAEVLGRPGLFPRSETAIPSPFEDAGR